jgi:hypothetical protein
MKNLFIFELDFFLTPYKYPQMNLLEIIATLAVFIAVGLVIGYTIGKRRQRVPAHKVLIEKITYDYLQERDELFTSMQENAQVNNKSRVMYAVKDYTWNN